MSKKIAVTLVGLAWMLLGLGVMAIYYGTLPTGASLWSVAAGLFLAGLVSMALFMGVQAGVPTRFGRALVQVGYLMFAPVALLAALTAPGPIEAASGYGSLTFVLIAPVAIMLYAGIAIALGVGFTGGLAVAAHSLALRVQPSSYARLVAARNSH
jgi:hypothetical protein